MTTLSRPDTHHRPAEPGEWVRSPKVLAVAGLVAALVLLMSFVSVVSGIAREGQARSALGLPSPTKAVTAVRRTAPSERAVAVLPGVDRV